MKYIQRYSCAYGEILLASDGEAITGLWFAGQKYFGRGLDPNAAERELEIFEQTKLWLSDYFQGKEPEGLPRLHLVGTDFEQEVWELLLKIPRGSITTYGALAKKIAEKRGISKFSAQAVGQAVGHNKISLLIPCHRVVGSNNSLTGYAGGLEKKEAFLRLEGAMP